MTAQQLLDELLELQKEGYDLDKLDVRYLLQCSSRLIADCDLDDGSFVLWS